MTVAADSGVAVGSVVETAVTVGAMAAVAAAATKWEDGELDGSLYVWLVLHVLIPESCI